MFDKIKKKLEYLIILLFIFWILSIIYLYYIWFDFRNLVNFNLNIYYKIGIIILLYCFRNYLFLPSTVIIIISWMIFNNYLLTFLIGFIWVSIGLIQTYFIWYIFRENLSKNGISKKIEKYNAEIRDKWAKIIFAWAMFPSLPTDIICYSAWFIEYNFFKFYLAAILGELPLIFIYSYLGNEAEKYMHYFVYFIIFFLIILLSYYYFKRKKT